MKRIAILLALALAGCRRPEPREASAAPVDSATSISDALDGFRAGMRPVDRLAETYASRDSLVARIAASLERRDTAALAAMRLTIDEFAYLYYPSNPQSRPPYELPPEIMWLQLRQQDARGLSRLLDRFGGSRPNPSHYRCDTPRIEGRNTIHARCRFADGTPIGALIERREGFKVLAFANDL